MGRRALRAREAAVSEQLAALGLRFPTSSVDAADARESLLGVLAARDRWNEGDPSLPATTAWPSEPLSMGELFVHCTKVDFSLRRTIDGMESSRAATIDALLLVRRLETLTATVEAAIASVNTDRWRELMVSLADLEFELVCYLLQHLIARPCPDLDRPDDPDAWQDHDGTNEVRLRLVDRMAATQDRVDASLAKKDGPHAVRYRAHLAARRITTHASADVACGVDTRARTGFDAARVTVAKDLIDAQLVAAGRTGRRSGEYGLLEGADAIVTHLWAGDLPGYEARLRSIARGPGRTALERVNLLRSTFPRVGRDPDVTLDLITEILDVADREPPAVRASVRALVELHLVMVLSGVCRARPDRASLLCGRIAGFESRQGWSSMAHVWLLPGQTSIALLHHPNDEVEVIDLPTLGDERSLEILVVDHAEEPVASHDVGPLRRKLAAQIRPLGHRLAMLGGPVTTHGFGHLKHLPLATLTGQGAILALRPGVRVLVRRRSWATPPPVVHTDRRFIIDDNLAGARSLPSPGSAIVSFDSSSAATALDGPPAGIRDALAEPARLLVYYGHGFVDQARGHHVGLVMGFVSEEERPVFLPSGLIAAQDLRGTEVALILACGAGQANVFTSGHIGLAEAFCLAGCRTVIAPLWPIERRHAVDFAERFLTRMDGGTDARTAWSEILGEDPNRFCSIALFAND